MNKFSFKNTQIFLYFMCAQNCSNNFKIFDF